MRNLFFLAYVVVGIFLLFQASKLIGTIIERKILDYPVDTPVEIKPEKRALPSGRLGYDTSILASPLFSIRETKAPASNPSQGGNPQGDTLLDSPLLRKYELNGVVLLEGGKSIAIIRRAGEKQGQIYRKGDRIDNIEVEKIERDRVLLNDGVSRIVLPMYYRFLAKAASLSPSAGPEMEKRAVEGADRSSGATQVRKVLSRSDVETKVFQKVNDILTQIAISPNMANGKMDGLKLLRVPASNIVYELGARSGDVIRRVNGHEVNQVDQMYKLWENVKDDSYITVDLERNSQMYTYSFEIRE
jgi:type II secretion system protein C